MSKYYHNGEWIADERETRKKFFDMAREIGREGRLKLIFAKYDDLIRKCSNDGEREDMKKYAVYEVWKCLGGGGELYVDGKLVAKEG